MQFQQNSLTQQFFIMKKTTLLTACLFFCTYIFSQIGTTEFGKNRVQYKKFKWAYYQTDNFNSYYSQNGEPLVIPDQKDESESVLTVPPVLFKILYCELIVSNK